MGVSLGQPGQHGAAYVWLSATQSVKTGQLTNNLKENVRLELASTQVYLAGVGIIDTSMWIKLVWR